MLTDESARKRIILEHCRRLNAGDVGGLLDLYAEDVRFEDPVGAGERTGREELRAHFERAVEANVHEVPGEPVASQDGVHALVPVSATLDGPPAGPGGVRSLEREYVLMLRVGSGGLIEELRAFWGAAEAGTDDAVRKNAPLEYARRINEGDLDGVMELFTDDIVFEDPVGSPPVRGKAAIRQNIAWAIECKVHEVPGRPVLALDGRTVVAPSIVTTSYPSNMRYEVIGVSEVDGDGLTRSLKAYWGITDVSLPDAPRLTGVAHSLAVTERLIENVRLSEARAGSS